MNPETFKSHALFLTLDQLNSLLQHKGVKERMDVENYSFFLSTYQYISDRVNMTLPAITQESDIVNLNNDIESGLHSIRQFLDRDNFGYLKNATSHFANAITRAKNFPVPAGSQDFSYSQTIADFQRLIQT